jgi:small-conductance mechanosensitive channel
MPSWERVAIVGGVLFVTAIAAILVDRAIARRDLPPDAVTRYRILRRMVISAVIAVGILSALLVIPQVRAVAGGILASSAVVAVVLGFAAQRTIGNFIAGLLIAVAQPLRLGDRIAIDDEQGTVEEIGLTYTFIRTPDNARLVIPNEKLASDTIRNSTIVSREKLAEVTVPIPLQSDLGDVVEALKMELQQQQEVEVFVSALEDKALVTLRAWAPDEVGAERLESELRIRAHARLRALGVWDSAT